LGLIINPSRTNFTAEILGLPEAIYYPFLLFEHLISMIVVGNILSFLSIIGLKMKSKNKYITILDIKKAKSFGIFGALILSILWEQVYQNNQDPLQFIFDMIGFLILIIYLNNVLPLNLKQPNNPIRKHPRV
jgi:multisubunit Na+/H+ antiporter MnhG subunit